MERRRRFTAAKIAWSVTAAGSPIYAANEKGRHADRRGAFRRAFTGRLSLCPSMRHAPRPKRRSVVTLAGPTRARTCHRGAPPGQSRPRAVTPLRSHAAAAGHFPAASSQRKARLPIHAGNVTPGTVTVRSNDLFRFGTLRAKRL